MKSLHIKKRSLLRLVLLSVYLLFFKPLHAQLVNEPPLDFDHINYDQGMSTGAMVDVFVDSKGFFWILTTGGINRYDGNEFKIFRSNASDPSTIGNGFPTAITEDKNGIIWIACDIPHGLNSYNPITGKFTRYCNDTVYGKKLPTSQIVHMLVDSSNVLWMCAEGEGVYSWDQKTKTITHFEYKPGDPTSIGENNIINGVIIPGDKILFYSASNIYLFNNRTKKFSTYIINNKYKLSFNKWMPGIFCDWEKRICIASDKGIYLLDSAMTLLFEYPLSLQKILTTNTNKFLQITPDKRIWIDADSGLFVLDPSETKYSVYKNDPNEPKSISRLMYRGITYDPSGVMWIRGGSGVNKISLEKEKFHIAYNPETFNRYGGPVASTVRHNYQDRFGRIFQTNPMGVFVFDFNTKKFLPFLPDKEASKFLKNHNARFIFHDTIGCYWFGIDNTKLVLYNPSLQTSKKWLYTDGFDFNSYGYTYMQSVLQDNKNHIWFAGAYSIYKYDMVTKKFKTYFIDASNKKNTINATAIVMKPGDGHVWFGTTGLSRYDEVTDSIHPILFSNDDASTTLSTSKISCAVSVGNNCMWIGTDGSGMFLFNFKTEQCRRISVADGLPNDRIFAITIDLNGTLWVSTDGGLCKYNPPSKPFSDRAAGLFKTYVTNYIWPVQGYSDKNKMLYFKMYGYTGLLYFHPDSLSNNPFIPPVYITNFKLFNKLVSVGDSTQVLDSAIEVKKRIVLSYRQNVFSFSFAALNFINSQKNQYAYRLIGFDKDWNHTDASHRIASYTNLDPGEYLFEVKASNNDGVWNENPVRLSIVITPPYWQTWWFRVLIILICIGIIYIIYKIRMRQLQKENNIRKNIASDLHDDLGSTLNSVKVYANLAEMEKEDSSHLKKIKETSQEAINGLRDIIWILDDKKDSLNHLLNRIKQFAEPLCNAAHINFIQETNEILRDYKLGKKEKRNLYMILKESINNSVKYASCENIQLKTSLKNRKLELSISDDGIGFETHLTNFGNGLKNIHSRSREMGYKFFIDSAKNKGTTIRLAKN